jgi:glycosyltransferase involved in cell wall biosynthesis
MKPERTSEMINHQDSLQDLTIFIPVHNGMPYIELLLKSILKEKVQWKIIISEDSSTDGTRQFLEELDDSRITILYSNARLTLSENWSTGINHANTKYVKLLCADDEFNIHFAAKSISLMKENSEVIAVLGKSEIVSTTNLKHHKLSISSWPIFGNIPCRVARFMILLSGRNIFGSPSNIIFRTEFLKSVMPWSDQHPYMIDVATYLKLFNSFPNHVIYSSKDFSSMFRLRPGSITSQNYETHLNQWKSVLLRELQDMVLWKRVPLQFIGICLAMLNNVIRKKTLEKAGMKPK